MIEIINITKKYRKGSTVFTALDHVSLSVRKGDFIVVTGASGSGKSTLLHTIGGLIVPDEGEVRFNDRDICSFSRRESELYRSRNVGFVFQQFHLMPYLTLIENIRMVCSDPSCLSSIDRYLEQCSLTPLKHKYPSELSVGEKQRTAFIRAVITRPDLLLADEPTGNLDPANSTVVMSLMKEFHRSGGTILLVSHDPRTSTYADYQITLQNGKFV